MPVDDKDLDILKATQDGLPVIGRPYVSAAAKVGLSESEVIKRLRRLLEEGVIRRMGATIAHRRAGFVENAMTAWLVPEERLEEAGRRLGARREVTHCYARKTAPAWPYNLYTMVHGKSRRECDEMIRKMSKEVDVADYVTLYSTREFKKTSFRLGPHTSPSPQGRPGKTDL